MNHLKARLSALRIYILCEVQVKFVNAKMIATQLNIGTKLKKFKFM